MGSNVLKDSKVQDALSEIASQTLIEVMSDKRVNQETSEFLNKVIHSTMQDYKLYKMFFGSQEYSKDNINKSPLGVSPEIKAKRKMRTNYNNLEQIQKKINDNPVDLNDFSSRLKGYNLETSRHQINNSKSDKHNFQMVNDNKIIDKNNQKFDYIVHKDSVEKRQALKERFNKNIQKIIELEDRDGRDDEEIKEFLYDNDRSKNKSL